MTWRVEHVRCGESGVGERGDLVAAGRVEHTSALAGMRVSYASAQLDEAALAATWHEQLATWLAEAVAAELPEPNAMVLATADADGFPSSRTMLAKVLDERGVVFFTNFTSAKMHALKATPYASATFPWLALQRQAHLRGPVEVLSVTETTEYWNTRPRGAQLGAWASAQSSVVRSRRALDAALDHAAQRFAAAEQVPLPPHWGGVRIRPDAVEFWQGMPNRMHDRLRFTLDGDGEWTVQRLAP